MTFCGFINFGLMKNNNESTVKTIAFKSDQYLLKGSLHLPENDLPPVVIGCHGLAANRQSPKQIGLAKACCRQGIAYFRFDHRGCGDSQRRFASVTTLEARCRDLIGAIQLIRSMNQFNGKIGLFGSSLGGTVCLSVAGSEEITAMVTFAAPLHHRLPQAAGQGSKLRFDITNTIRGVNNIHIFHGERDTVVPLAHARHLYANAALPKKLTIQPAGDHRMSNTVHQELFRKESVSWFASSFF